MFRSPAVFEPYEGKPATLVLLKAVSRVFRDFRYVRTFIEEDGRGMALAFEAKIGTRQVEGVDLLRLERPRAGRRLPGDGAPALRARGADARRWCR